MFESVQELKPLGVGINLQPNTVRELYNLGLGTHKHRMVIYPILHPDPETGEAEINWIAEVAHENPMIDRDPIPTWQDGKVVLILRYRGAGPFGLLNMVDDRCGGEFDNIDDVIPADERAKFMAKHKAAAGFAIKN